MEHFIPDTLKYNAYREIAENIDAAKEILKEKKLAYGEGAVVQYYTSDASDGERKVSMLFSIGGFDAPFFFTDSETATPGNIDIDSSLDKDSSNAIENRTVAEAIDEINRKIESNDVQPDFDINDSEDKGYIKNRPIYKTTSVNNIVIGTPSSTMDSGDGPTPPENNSEFPWVGESVCIIYVNGTPKDNIMKSGTINEAESHAHKDSYDSEYVYDEPLIHTNEGFISDVATEIFKLSLSQEDASDITDSGCRVYMLKNENFSNDEELMNYIIETMNITIDDIVTNHDAILDIIGDSMYRALGGVLVFNPSYESEDNYINGIAFIYNPVDKFKTHWEIDTNTNLIRIETWVYGKYMYLTLIPYTNFEGSIWEKAVETTLSDYGIDSLWSGSEQTTEYHKLDSGYLPYDIAPELGEPRIIGWTAPPMTSAKMPIVECNFFTQLMLPSGHDSYFFNINMPEGVENLMKKYLNIENDSEIVFCFAEPLSIIYIDESSSLGINLPIYMNYASKSYNMINGSALPNDANYKITCLQLNSTGSIVGVIGTTNSTSVSQQKYITVFVTARYIATGDYMNPNDLVL